MNRHRPTNRTVVILTLLLIVQIAAYAAIDVVITTAARTAVHEELAKGERVFRQLLLQDRQRLERASRALSEDAHVHRALAGEEHDALGAVLAAHARRTGAATAMLIGPDAGVIADAAGRAAPESRFAAPGLIEQARQDGDAAAILLIEGRLSQVTLTPVPGPTPAAWVAMALPLGERMARELKSLTALEVTFLGLSRRGDRALIASTLSPDLATAVLEQARHGMGAGPAFSAGAYEALPVPLQQDGLGEESVAILQRPLAAATRPWKGLQDALLALTLAATALAAIARLLGVLDLARCRGALAVLAGRTRADVSHAQPAPDGDGEIAVLSKAFDHMIDTLATREAKITELAYRDALTGLPNRLLFSDRLQQAIAQALRASSSTSVLVLDLDRFKYVNESLGHPVGDRLLRETGRVLEHALQRASDTAARLGGDEFAVLLPMADAEEAKQVARHIIAALDQPVVLDGQSVDVSASIGIATCPAHGEDAASLLRHADMAMYVAKRSSAGFALYDPRLHEHQPERLSLLGELRRAVAADELTVFYQPKIELATGCVLYAECLVRWQHPSRGFVPPDQFIPFAEKTGFVGAITRWVVEAVLAQSAAWMRLGLAMNVSINISARDLLDAELPDRFAESLRRHGVPPERVWLEITESAIMEDPKHALETLDRLHAMGMTLSIDDFGTGYSSLAYLKRLPVDEIKIDKSFVIGMMEDDDDATIVRSTIDLAHNMGLKVVAEGVETPQMLARLRELGCDLAQGYHISRPLAADKFERWLAESSWSSLTGPVVAEHVC